MIAVSGAAVVVGAAGASWALLRDHRSPAAHRTAAASHTPAGTVTDFSDGPVHFHAVFSGPFPFESVQTFVVEGKQVKGAQWVAGDHADDAQFVQTFTFTPDVSLQDSNGTLDGDIHGELNLVNGTLMSETFGAYQGFPSADATFSFPASATGGARYERLRAILAGHTIFHVFVTSPVNPPKLFAPLAASLKILAHAP
jgi:hypothetical protein